MHSLILAGSVIGLTLLLTIQIYATTDGAALGEKELEIHALTTLAGSERKANRWYRTIERYRNHKERIKSKLAEGREVSGGGLRHLMAMSNLSESMTVKEREVLWKITHRTIDLDAYIASDGEFTERKYDEVRYMEEVHVIGSIFDHMPMDPAEFSVADIKSMRTERRYANEMYRKGEYGKAYPYLLDLAKRGFKDSQSRLAYILLNGTENVEKSNLRALGWLGTAAYGDTEPQFRVLFKKYMAEVPESVRQTVESVVDGYQKSFAHDEHQNCSTDHNYTDGSRVKKTFCRFKLESIAEACEAGTGGGRCWAHAVNVSANEN